VAARVTPSSTPAVEPSKPSSEVHTSLRAWALASIADALNRHGLATLVPLKIIAGISGRSCHNSKTPRARKPSDPSSGHDRSSERSITAARSLDRDTKPTNVRGVSTNASHAMAAAR
jgi:hypothetical protein